MLTYSVATAALALTGCKKKKKVITTVSVKNDSGVIVDSFSVTIDTTDLDQDDPVAIGGTATSPKLKLPGKKNGDLVDLTLNDIFIAATDVAGNVSATGLKVVVGSANLFTFTAVTPPTVPATYTLVRTSP